jgi:hypothetical protein
VLDVLKDIPLRILPGGLFMLTEKGPYIGAPDLNIRANGQKSDVLDYCTVWVDGEAAFVRWVGDTHLNEKPKAVYEEYLWVRRDFVPLVQRGVQVQSTLLDKIRQAAREFVEVWELSQELPAVKGK